MPSDPKSTLAGLIREWQERVCPTQDETSSSCYECGQDFAREVCAAQARAAHADLLALAGAFDAEVERCERCREMHLDSGSERDMAAAHDLYIRAAAYEEAAAQLRALLGEVGE